MIKLSTSSLVKNIVDFKNHIKFIENNNNEILENELDYITSQLLM